LPVPPDATSDAPAQRPPVDRQVGADGIGVHEADWGRWITFDGGEPSKRALVVLVIVMIEAEPAAKADGRRKLG